MTGEQLHNLYPLLYNDAVAEITSAETGRTGLVWGRSTYAGGQRHAAQWGGDPNCTFQALASTLRGGLSFGLSGHAFWSHDIGGFHGEPTPEVYVRWAQFGLFSPLARAHGTTSRLPWDFGAEALRIVRAYLQLRYRLLPYLYSYAQVAAETGVPLMRAMVLEFPDDPNTYHLDLQYLFGSEFLVAPVYNASSLRHVYFPAGGWVDFWSHDVIEGPQTRAIQAPLDQLPLYVRANALIPTIEPQLPIQDGPFDHVTFDAYLIDQGEFELYDVDGTTHVSAKLGGTELVVEVQGTKRAIGLRLIPLPGVPLVERVFVNERELQKVTDTKVDRDGWTISDNRSVYVNIVL
jgi:alpha-D-xyloside xylohydrolase